MEIIHNKTAKTTQIPSSRVELSFFKAPPFQNAKIMTSKWHASRFHQNMQQTLIGNKATTDHLKVNFPSMIGMHLSFAEANFNLGRQIYKLMSRGLINEQRVDVPRLKVEPVQRGYADHKQCFKLCLRVFDFGLISQPERQCIASCLGKYREAERYMAEKVHQIMHAQAMGNPEVKALYNGTSEQAKAIVGDQL